MTNHASLSGSLMDESKFGSCQENGTCLTALRQVKSLVEGGLWCGAVFQELGSVSSNERNCYCFSIPKHFGQFHAPNFVGTVWAWGFLFQLECALVHKVRSVKALLSEFVVTSLCRVLIST